MKRFCVRHGNYKGEHYIYDNPEEARRELGSALIIKDWETCLPYDIKDGDWMHLTDGTVAQILTKRLFKQSEHQIKHWGAIPMRYAVRFAFYTVPMWYRKRTDEWARGRVLGQPALQSSQMARSVKSFAIGRVHKRDDKIAMKLAFAQLILRGMSPHDATHSVITLYDNTFKTPQQVYRIRKRLMADELVISTLHDGVAPFKELLSKRFTEKELVDQLALLLEKSRPGTMNHRENLKLILELTGLMEPAQKKVQKAKDGDKIQEVAFEDVTPPPLGKAS